MTAAQGGRCPAHLKQTFEACQPAVGRPSSLRIEAAYPKPSLWSGLNQLQPLELQPVGADVRKIVLRLLHKPTFGAATEDL